MSEMQILIATDIGDTAVIRSREKSSSFVWIIGPILLILTQLLQMSPSSVTVFAALCIQYFFARAFTISLPRSFVASDQQGKE